MIGITLESLFLYAMGMAFEENFQLPDLLAPNCTSFFQHNSRPLPIVFSWIACPQLFLPNLNKTFQYSNIPKHHSAYPKKMLERKCITYNTSMELAGKSRFTKHVIVLNKQVLSKC